MKVLFLAHLFPLPLDSGGKIKSYCTLKTLAKEHEVQVLAYLRTDEEWRLVCELRRICQDAYLVPLQRGALRQMADLASSLLTGRSFIVSRDDRAHMRAAFRNLVSSFSPDVVHIDHLQMAQFVDSGGSYRTVLDHHNVESVIVRRVAETAKSRMTRLYAGVEWPKLQRYELQACRSSDMVLTVSEEDRRTLQELDWRIDNIHCVPIGVDVDHFRPVERNTASRNILSVGTMYWPPNVDSMLYFCREIFPLVKDRVPGSTLTIAGQRPAATVRALASDPAVMVTGYVEDLTDLARQCGVFVVPLRSGSGVRVKILSALGMGLPVVSTSVGAEGLEVTDGKHVLIADTPEEFAEATARILEDDVLARSLGENGRRLVCEKYSWEVVGERLLHLYRHVLCGPDAGREER